MSHITLVRRGWVSTDNSDNSNGRNRTKNIGERRETQKRSNLYKQIRIRRKMLKVCKLPIEINLNAKFALKRRCHSHEIGLPDACETKILEMVHVDLAGPIDPIAKDRFKYVLGCIDDFSGLLVTYMLKNKSDAQKAFEKIIADILPNGNLKYVRTHQKTEFSSGALKSVLIKNKKIITRKQHPICHTKTAQLKGRGAQFLKWLDVF